MLFNLEGVVRREVKIDIGDFDKLSKNHWLHYDGEFQGGLNNGHGVILFCNMW